MTKDALLNLINQSNHIDRLRIMQQIDKEENILKKGEMISSKDQNLQYIDGVLRVRRNSLSVGWNEIKYIPTQDEVCPHCKKRFFSVHLPDLKEDISGIHYHSNCYMIKDINDNKNIFKKIITDNFAKSLLRQGVDFSIKEYTLYNISFDIETSICNMEINQETDKDENIEITLKMFKNSNIKDRYFNSNWKVYDNYALIKVKSLDSLSIAIKSFTEQFMNKSLY